MRLNDLSLTLSEISEAESPETQTEPRLDLEPAMIAGGRKSGLDYKEKKVKGALDRVTLTLTGKNSEHATKLSKKYNEIKILSEQLSKMKDLFNLDAKEHMLQYFNAEDEVLTRVIKTASLTTTLSKRTVATYERADLEGFYKELLVLLPELEDKLKILRDKYTTVEKLEKSPSLRVKLPGEKDPPDDVEESINEAVGDVWSKITALGNRLLQVYKAWGSQFDKKLDILATRYTQVEESAEPEIVEEDEAPGFKPDLEGLVYETNEVKTLADELSDEILNLQHFASIECNDENLANKFKEIYFTASKVKADLFSILYSLKEKTTEVPVKEELEDTHENLVDLAKTIRNYANSPGKKQAVEDRVSLMLFHKSRPLRQLSLFALLAAIQELPEEALKEIANLVRG